MSNKENLNTSAIETLRISLSTKEPSKQSNCKTSNLLEFQRLQCSFPIGGLYPH